MGVVGKILHEMKRERVQRGYAYKDRLIPSGIYNALKARKKCMECGKKFGDRIPQIHHRIPLSKNGTNDEKNLMAVCHKCHEMLDAAEGVGDGR